MTPVDTMFTKEQLADLEAGRSFEERLGLPTESACLSVVPTEPPEGGGVGAQTWDSIWWPKELQKVDVAGRWALRHGPAHRSARRGGGIEFATFFLGFGGAWRGTTARS
jgi:hypothetical protein